MELGRVLKPFAYAGLVLLYVLIAGRYIGFPYALVAVDGRSMEPTLHFGDLVLVKRVVNVSEVKPGDIVLVCSTPRSCILHRLLEVRDGLIVTKGDANPYPDPPAPLGQLRYVYVARIPREAYLAPLGGYVVYKVYTVVAAAERRRLRAEYLLATVVAVQIAVLFTALLVAPSPRPVDVFSHLRPTLVLNYARLTDGGSIVVRASAQNLGGVVGTLDCSLAAGNLSEPCMLAGVTLEGGVFHALAVPSTGRVYLEAYTHNIRSVLLRFTVNFTNALLKARIIVNTPWATPKATMLPNGTIVVRNPNPIPIPARVKLILINYTSQTRRLETVNVTLPPAASYRFTVPKSWSYVAVNIYTLAPGGKWVLIGSRGYYHRG